MDPVVLYLLLKRKKRVNRRFWIHPLIQARSEFGEHLKLEKMLQLYPDKFQNYTRLTPNQFLKLEELTSGISKQSTTYREPIPARTRLLITLRYLSTGDSLRSIATSFCVGTSTTRIIILETCEAIWNCLSPTYVQAPTTIDDWLTIANDFQEHWQLPNCIGALDGKHVQIICPRKSGSLYFNYKNSFSIVLMASCTAQYLFTSVDVGAFGKQSDGGVFANSGLGSLLEQGKLDIQGQYALPNSTQSSQLYFVGDEAFPLKPHLLRPYPSKDLDTSKRIFNYRLSRGRRVIENAFGILSSRFRVLRKPIYSAPENAVSIVKACVALHNYILILEDKKPGNSRPPLRDKTNPSVHRMETGADLRNRMSNYFMNEGQVSWQYDSVFSL